MVVNIDTHSSTFEFSTGKWAMTKTVQLLCCLSLAHTYTMTSSLLMCLDTHKYRAAPSHVSIISFSRSTLLLLCCPVTKAFTHQESFKNNWWMVTLPGWCLHGWPYLINMLWHGALCLPNHGVENLIDTADCPRITFCASFCKCPFPLKTAHMYHICFLFVF